MQKRTEEPQPLTGNNLAVGCREGTSKMLYNFVTLHIKMVKGKVHPNGFQHLKKLKWFDKSLLDNNMSRRKTLLTFVILR